MNEQIETEVQEMFCFNCSHRQQVKTELGRRFYIERCEKCNQMAPFITDGERP